MIKLEPGHLPNWWTLCCLSAAWSRARGRKNLFYLRRICRLITETNGPVLECGSGVTTLLLGLMGEKCGKAVYTLEDNPETLAFMSVWLKRFHIQNIHLIHAPMISYSDYHWYNVSHHDLPDDFSLVICENAGGCRLTGHLGLLPAMCDRLSADCRVLLGCARNLDEPEVIKEWCKVRDLNPQPASWLRPFTEIALL